MNVNDLNSFNTMFNANNNDNNNGIGIASSMNDDNRLKERSCYGHKETTFSMPHSTNGALLASASQDSIVRTWDTKTNEQTHVLNGHDYEHECLRAIFFVVWMLGKKQTETHKNW